ncbi:response regulator transcription factor [Pseudoalteromonas fenneropenaei]|uniref:Response regulator transcription factor n=1 Tax=Pseudoalteromonas fenneropenaei TaxID=1737459 RepID=A0ABV7CHI3_9GAMM
MSAALKLLIVEDNPALCRNLESYFADKNVTLDFACDGKLALQLLLTQFYDCVVLDLGLPKLDGLAVCQQLRAQANRHIPVLMLTARDGLDDKLQGFASGADDYLCKPFAFDELYVRCQALAKRHLLHRAQTLVIGTGERRLSLNTQTQQVMRAEVMLELTPIAFRIVQILMENHPRAITRSELMERIWGDEQTDSDALRSHIYQLRQVIDKPFATPVIKTIHGIGFALEIRA